MEKHLDWLRVETSQLKRLHFDMAAADPEPEEHCRRCPEGIADDYDRQALREDDEARIEQRLGH